MGTTEEVATGSSKLFLSSRTAVCCADNSAAVSAASANSSSAKLVPYPTVYVRHEFPYRFIRASNNAESTPPLSNNPTGTSLSRCLFTDLLYSSSSSSRASLADFAGEKGTGLNRYHRRVL